MFEVLSNKLSVVFRKLSSRGKLSEKDIDDALRQVRLALLEPSSRPPSIAWGQLQLA